MKTSKPLGLQGIALDRTYSTDARQRIISAADRLFAERDYREFPSVNDVRSEARADMHATLAVMREWREANAARLAGATTGPAKAPAPSPVPGELPEELKNAALQSMEGMTRKLWARALEEARKQAKTEPADWAAERQRISLAFANAELAHQEQASVLRAQVEALQAENAALKAQLKS
ncbi:DNA-binding protein [Geopseudomonas aromaticivorans]